MKSVFGIAFAVLAVISSSACRQSPPPEVVDLQAVLPAADATEILAGYPNIRATLASDDTTGIPVGDRFLVIEGIDEPGRRHRAGEYIAGFLRDPDMKAQVEAERAAYEAMTPRQKLDHMVADLTGRYPGFSYEWVGAAEGNVQARHDDRGLLIHGVDDAMAREEIASGIVRFQRQIDERPEG